MTSLCCDVLTVLKGKTMATAESLTGGGIGAALTGVSGASAVYKGGIISYTNAIKHKLLGVPAEILDQYGAVSEPVAKAMAEGARKVLEADVAVSVTGLAGPAGDEYGNPVIYADATYNKEQIKQFNSLVGMGECSVMILSEYMYNDMLSRREDVPLLLTAGEIFGDNIPESALSHGIKLCDTGAYGYFESFAAIPDDAVLCIMRPFVVGNNADANEFAIEYFKNIVYFGN